MQKSRTYEYDVRPFDPALMREFTGLEYLGKVFNREVAGASIAQTLGFAPGHLEAGRVIFDGLPEDFVLNPIGSVHGGYAAAMLDTVLGCAVHSALERGVGYTTVELKINYVRAMTAQTGPVRAEGTLIHLGRSLATAEAKLYGRDDGRLYAHGSTTCMLFPVATPSRGAEAQ
jgi:uncharacterized protein (TIGR00369 family)